MVLFEQRREWIAAEIWDLRIVLVSMGEGLFQMNHFEEKHTSQWPFKFSKMKRRILYIIFAFIAEYITDFTFLYQYSDGSYYNAGINDLMFATTFTLMALALISFESYE